MPKSTAASRRLPRKAILLAWLVAGTLDMLGAILVYTVLLQKTTAEKIVRGIASGIFKNHAMTGGTEMLLYGVLFHYFIAFCFTVFYFLIFPYVPFFRKQKIIGGLLYGAFIWIVMNLIVLTIVFPNRTMPTLSSALIGASILMIMIGLPLSFFANKHYETQAN
jgi:uncharacterized membrane protein YagU involved in acid resistance